ncbi:exonuclease SbcCD subunit D C-terminal domain-containing protein [Chlorobium limicola]|uniref:Nuclease SbcCD subunit D n=1 Tax=Chlorobium limicola TaxID=1092 RepID=A0A117MQH8_CHLLI|nr:exonuclease SbcCD subunit D C-terminal domain-containing protein [Chlorobium limicola]KUL30159.1 DNA exonuclease SbcCD subunit SbcD [Chlorobium limicola]
MKFLHTSDWHLGRTLYGHSRYNEFTAFLDWLHALIETEKVDALLVAGDVFDTSVPGSRVQELYYGFLYRMARSKVCRHVVITAGNHDSPSFLDAPKALLRTLDVHVVGSIGDDPMDEVVVLRDRRGKAEAVVCAVPHLRDRDIRSVGPGESMDEKNRKLIEGIERHYREVCMAAEQRRLQEGGFLPMIAMGHLFTAGGSTVEGDGVREIYIGSLAHVSSSVFPEGIDYLALGHLHVPQRVAGEEHLRYSGSPVPMGFGEARQRKEVVLVEFSGGERTITPVQVPCFQQLERISGTLDAIIARIFELKASGSTAWLEIEYVGDELPGDLRSIIDEAVKGSSLEIRRLRNNRVATFAMQRLSEEESLEAMSELDVFSRCLDAGKVSEEKRPTLMHAFQEVLDMMHEEEH